MTEDIKPNPQEAQTADAKLAAESMIEGKEKLPKVDIEADYEASKEFSVSEVDRTSQGESLAEEAVRPNYEMSDVEDMKSDPNTSGDPGDYLEMAKDVNPRIV